ncbi:MAG: hypothetical protein KAU14_00395 [Thermoplasmata archaeon]|nr:hypothetical protein [Thermoplasmata archaeon]
METLMDLEELVRRLYREGRPGKEIVDHLTSTGISKEFAHALLLEIENSEKLEGMDREIKELINFQPTGLEAGNAGMGSRGEGDFIIHHSIGRVADLGDAVVGPANHDDGGVVRIPHGDYLVVSVDGLHSRLGHFPFLAGFHVARACLRDALVMGAGPIALFSDAHLGNNGDPAIILDYTAGISTVGELTNVPLVAGSTLRIAGDLVTGDRLSGAAGAVGIARHLTPRREAKPGDILIMTRGSGGGTIAATAIFHGRGEVLKETLNLDFIRFTRKFLGHPLSSKVHAMTDVTNGGIRGDAREIARTAGVNVVIFPDRFLSLVNPKVREMLESLNIDPLGVSVDSLLVICSPETGEKVLDLMAEHDMQGDIVGRIESGEGKVFFQTSKGRKEVRPEFRESPYTPVKVVADREKLDPEFVRAKMEEAVKNSLRKRAWLVDRLKN